MILQTSCRFLGKVSKPEGPNYHIETSHLIYIANEFNGFWWCCFFQRGIFEQTLVLLDLLCNLIFYLFISDDNYPVDIHHLVDFYKYLYKRNITMCMYIHID